MISVRTRVPGVRRPSELCLASLLGLAAVACAGLEPDTVRDGGMSSPSSSESDGGPIQDTDAGTRDGATSAARTTDAGTTDAGTTDAGTNEAGTNETGTDDGGTGTDDAETQDPGACSAGESYCVNRVRHQCSDDGQWSEELCPFVCEQGECTGSCVPGATRCHADGQTPQTCQGGDWVNGTPCESVCSSGQCAGSCVPSARRCNDTQPLVCDQTGTWQPDGAPCPYVCDDTSAMCTGECVPGDTGCVAATTTPRRCTSDGVWMVTPVTPGSCGAECTPERSRCDANDRFQVCASDGLWDPAVSTLGECGVEQTQAQICLDNSPNGPSSIPATMTLDNVTVAVRFCGEATFTTIGSLVPDTVSGCHSFEWTTETGQTIADVAEVRVSIDGDDLFWLDQLTLGPAAGEPVWTGGSDNLWGFCLSTDALDAQSAPWSGACSPAEAAASMTWQTLLGC